MPEMVSYIFGSLGNSEEAIKRINKVLKSQAKINRTVAVLGLFAASYMIVADIHCREQQSKIDALIEEVDALKRAKKGE